MITQDQYNNWLEWLEENNQTSKFLNQKGTVGAVVIDLQGGNDAVDLWTKIHDEAETLRSRTTPLYVHKRIMDTLPDDTYRGHHPWYKRSVAMNPPAMIAAAAALLGIGAIIAHAVFG